MQSNNPLSRRNFLKSSVVAGTAGVMGGIPLLSSCTTQKKKQGEELQLPQLREQAPDGAVIKAGLIGCGGRGTGAAIDFLNAGPNLQIVALGDVFKDKLDACRDVLKKEKNVDVPDENCFIGFNSYQKVMDAGIDVVLLCTPPHFRPTHVEAAVDARKHIFMEKPVAVDPMGVRKVLASVKRAQSLNLNIISGTIRRSQKDYMETRRRVLNGEIGDITGAHIIRNGGALWFRTKRPEWSDMEYMLRNWVNFCWLSGDHITEQFIHEIDVMNWYLGKYPVKASEWKVTNPFVQEHINLVTAIRTGNTINDGEDQAFSSLVAIMGRVAAYTGKDVTWDEILNSGLRLGPEVYDMGPVEGVGETIPVAGIPHKE